MLPSNFSSTWSSAVISFSGDLVSSFPFSDVLAGADAGGPFSKANLFKKAKFHTTTHTNNCHTHVAS